MEKLLNELKERFTILSDNFELVYSDDKCLETYRREIKEIEKILEERGSVNPPHFARYLFRMAESRRFEKSFH